MSVCRTGAGAAQGWRVRRQGAGRHRRGGVVPARGRVARDGAAPPGRRGRARGRARRPGPPRDAGRQQHHRVPVARHERRGADEGVRPQRRRLRGHVRGVLSADGRPEEPRADDAVEQLRLGGAHDVPHHQPQCEGREGARPQGGPARHALPRRAVPAAHHERDRRRAHGDLGHVRRGGHLQGPDQSEEADVRLRRRRGRHLRQGTRVRHVRPPRVLQRHALHHRGRAQVRHGPHDHLPAAHARAARPLRGLPRQGHQRREDGRDRRGARAGEGPRSRPHRPRRHRSTPDGQHRRAGGAERGLREEQEAFTARGGKVVYCCAGAKDAPDDAPTSTSGDAVVEAVRRLFPTH